jgi:hypothetical protein
MKLWNKVFEHLDLAIHMYAFNLLIFLIFFVLMISSQLGLRKKQGGVFFSLTHILNNHCCYVDAQLVFWNIMVALCYNTWQLCTPTNPNFHYIVNVRHAWLIFCYLNVLVLHQWYLICSFFNFPFAWIWNLNLQCFATYILTLIKWLPFYAHCCDYVGEVSKDKCKFNPIRIEKDLHCQTTPNFHDVNKFGL